MANINVYGEFYNDTPDGFIAPASQIKDVRLGKRQDQINEELMREVSDSNTAYLVCSTPGSTAAKTIDLDSFTLSTNVRLLIKFEHAHTNTQYTPTLNIGGTGIEAIQFEGTAASYMNTWADGEVLDVYYDGTQYVARRTKYKIGDVGYVECNTAAGTVGKEVNDFITLSGFELGKNVRVLVKMTYTNTATNPTLNINGTGAKSIVYNGSIASSSNVWEAGEVLDVYYNGTNYIARPYLNVDDEPTAGSDNLVKSGGVFPILDAVSDLETLTAVETSDGYWIQDSGQPSANQYFKNAKYNVEANKSYCFTSIFLGSANIHFLHFYDSSNGYLGNAVLVGETGRATGVWFVTPANTSYIRINASLSAAIYLKKHFLIKSSDLKAQIETINGNITTLNNSLSSTINEVEEFKADISGATNLTPSSENLSKFINHNNGSEASNQWFKYYKFAITGGKYYLLTTNLSNGSIAALCYFDSNNQYIGYDLYNETLNFSCTDKVIKAPDNAAYVCVNGARYINIMLKSVDDAIRSTELEKQIKKNEEKISDIQSITPLEKVNGYYLNDSGQPVAFAALNYKKYEVEGGKRYLFTSGFPSTITVYVAFWYDSFDNYISKEPYKGSNTESIRWDDQEIEAPANAAYARIVYFNSQVIDFKQYTNVILSRDLQKQINDKDGDVKELKEVVKELLTLTPEIINGSFYTDNGAIAQSVWTKIYKYSVSPNTVYMFSSSLSSLSAGLYYVYYFDSNNNYISRDVQFNNVEAVNVEVITPSNCVYLCINCHSNLDASLKCWGNYILSRDLKNDLDVLKKTRTKVVIKYLDRDIAANIGNDNRKIIFYVRAKYNSTKDIIITHYINGNMCLTFMSTYVGSNTLTDAQLMTNTYLMSEHQDSTAPLFQAEQYWHLFGQHGYLVPLMDNSAGLTIDDEGSTWKDQLDRQYKIGLVKSNKVYLLPIWYQDSGHTVRGWRDGIQSHDGGAITTLTHVSGATHTSTITVSGYSSEQLRPVMSLKNRTWLVDGKEVTQPGTYYCDDFIVSESAVGYDPSTIVNMFSAIGDNIDLTGATPMINFTFSYRYVGAQCCVNTTIDIRREIKALMYGAIQQQFFWDNGDYKAMMMIPKAKINRDIEIDKPFNSADSTALLHFVNRNTTNLKDVDDQIDRCIGFLYNPNTGDYLIGMAAGLSIVSGDTVKSKRNQNNLAGSYLLDFDPGQRNKFYIAAFNNSPYEANNDGYFPDTLFKEINYYVSYFDPAENVGQVYWYKDGSNYIIYCHCQSIQNRISINVPECMEGLKLSIVEKTENVELLTDTIQNCKFFINYNTADANYIVLVTS